MASFQRKYTDEQREALCEAYEDRRVRPARRVVELAAAGELTHKGQKVEPFTVGEDYIRDQVRHLRKRRRGLTTSELAQAAPRDAIEILRRRLVNAADAMLADSERDIRRDPKTADPERLRQIARLVREAQAIPGPNEPRKPSPGQKVEGEREGAPTRHGLAGKILADARRTAGGGPAPSAHHPQHQHTEDSSAMDDTRSTQHRADDETDNAAGSRAAAAASPSLRRSHWH